MPPRIPSLPGMRLAVVPAKVTGVALNAIGRSLRHPVYPELPAPPLTPGYLASVAVDELVVGLFKSPRRFPDTDEMQRVATDLAAARDHFDRAGWLAEPARYHRTPPAIRPVIRDRRSRGVAYEHLEWDSGFAPRSGEVGRERWLANDANRRAHAYVLRHPEPGRPWVVCLHGLGTGMPVADFFAFRVERMVEELGVNVAVPVLPMHGPRKQSRFAIDEFLTYDLVGTVHAVTQAMWDVRGLLGWLRSSEGATTIGLHGVSLGAYCAAVLSSLDDGLDFTILGVPLADVPSLYATHAPPLIRRRAVSLGLVGQVAHEVHRVISPLAMNPLVPHGRRAIYAGLGDRMSTATQAHHLWRHWEQPDVHWYPGNHVGFVFNRSVRRWVAAKQADYLGSPADRVVAA